MTRKELTIVKDLLIRVKPQDAFIAEAIAYVNKDLALRDQQAARALHDRSERYYEYLR